MDFLELLRHLNHNSRYMYFLVFLGRYDRMSGLMDFFDFLGHRTCGLFFSLLGNSGHISGEVYFLVFLSQRNEIFATGIKIWTC